MNYTLGRRRYRQSSAIREMFSEVSIEAKNLVQPYFLYQGLQAPTQLLALEGQLKHNEESLLHAIEDCLEHNLRQILIFISPEHKTASEFNYDFDQQVITNIKARFGTDIILMSDLCLCPQTIDGHCGFIKHDQSGDHIDNHSSVEELVKKGKAHALAGIDFLLPSDMMDDRVLALRKMLESEKLERTLIMSHSAKFASNLYGPFREALKSAPKGDRKGYQIDYRNGSDAILSTLRDARQGADVLMVKPATWYLDIIKEIKMHPETSHIPLAAYHVGGEYQMIHLMAKNNLISFKEGLKESLTAIKRAGADFILTYGALEFLKNEKN